MVNTFPYNGLHPDGYLNSDGVQLKKFSLKREDSECDRGNTDDLYLDIERTSENGYAFVAKSRDDTVRCSGAMLVGATFVVEWGNKRTRILRISQMGLADVEHAELANANSLPSTRTVYLITPKDQPANSLCTSRPIGVKAGPTPVLNKGSIRGQLLSVESEELASYAIIIPGAVYDHNGDLIPESLDTVSTPKGRHGWFNIACASDGLARTELSGLETDPITDRATAEARLPALHMFTAQYCSGISATLRGTPIKWSKKGIYSKPESEKDGPIEARWGNKGATCLWHSRLWIPNKTISLPPQLLDFEEFKKLTLPMGEEEFLSLVSKACAARGEPIPLCNDPSPSDALTSYTMNHRHHDKQGASVRQQSR